MIGMPGTKRRYVFWLAKLIKPVVVEAMRQENAALNRVLLYIMEGSSPITHRDSSKTRPTRGHPS